MRDVTSLDGDWLFRHEGDRHFRTVTVPAPWQAQCPDLRQTSGRAVYLRSFARPKGPAVLCFGAVSYLAKVLVNGQTLALHEGGWLPFEVPLPPDLLQDDNVLEVRCLLPDASPNLEGIAFAEIPHGKQSWYGPLGGIWQSVTLEVRDPVHLSHAAIRAETEGAVHVTLTLPKAALGAEARLTILAGDGPVAQTRLPVTACTLQVPLQVANPALWSPDSPSLYRLQVTLAKGQVLDTTDHSFGFRRFEAREGRLLLNGQPLLLRAALDQDYWPDGLCSPPSLEALEDQARKAKAMGFNMLRCHLKVPDPRYLEVADRLGLLIWAELPNVAVLTEASARRLKETMAGIVARDGNHPSIVIWTLVNEGWGLRLAEEAGHRRWLAETFDWLKALDPTRLVCDNSPCQGNFHVKGDLDDFHYYRAFPEHRVAFESLTAEVAGGAPWTWTPHGDGVRRGDEPRLVSEFGAWGLPQVTGAPWWLTTGAGFGEGTALPQRLADRVEALGLDRVFGGLAGFVTATQWHQFAALKHAVETIRQFPAIAGYVATQLTDVQWEANGLLDLHRRPRAFHDRLAEVNADLVILPQVRRTTVRAGEALAVEVRLATAGRAQAPCRLRWQAEGLSGEIACEGAVAMSVALLGQIRLAVPKGPARSLVLKLELWQDEGIIQRNQVDILVLAPRPLPDVLVSAKGALAERARALGYGLAPPELADVTLTEALGPQDLTRIAQGARYLVLPALDAGADRPLGGGVTARSRDGTVWRGDWIGCFSWLRRAGAFAALPGGPMLDLGFADVAPLHVLEGWAPEAFPAEVAAGLVVGWGHRPAVLLGAKRLGQGGFVATTFRLMAEGDPLADALFDAAVTHAALTT